MVEGIILVVNETNNILLLGVAQKFVSATGEEAEVLKSLGNTFLLAENWGLKIAMVFLALGALLYGILFISTSTVPSVLGWWALVASILAVVGRGLTLVLPDVGLVAISFVPYMLFEVVFGVWLLFRGGQICLS